jgi:hypothetical protein
VLAQEDKENVTMKNTQAVDNSQRMMLLIGYCKKYVDNAYSNLIRNIDYFYFTFIIQMS